MPILQYIGNEAPLCQSGVDPRRIVAAGVQHHDGAGCQFTQVCQHAVEVQPVVAGIIVGIMHHRKTCGREQRLMVGPAGPADGHPGTGQDLLEEIGADPQCTRTAQGLYSQRTVFRHQWRVLAQQQFLRTLVVARDPVDRQIIAGFGLLVQLLFSHANRFQQGNAPGVIGIDPDTQVDFVAAFIGLELFIQAQDGVAGCQFNGGKNG